MLQVLPVTNGKLWQIKSRKIFHLCFARNCIEYMTSGKTIQSAKPNLIGGGAQAHGGARGGTLSIYPCCTLPRRQKLDTVAQMLDGDRGAG